LYDVIVVGGGPAGSTLAALLARRGRRVALFEKERFPRFHIGESLLPCSMPLFEKLGVMPALERADFLPKFAAEFVSADGSQRKRYPFADGFLGGPPSAFEVDRADFDKVLLDHAAAQGASVEEECQVTRFTAELGGPAEVTVRDKSGTERTERAELLVDATGQSALLAARLGLRRMEPGLRNFAVFSHFEGAARAQGAAEGDISVVLVDEGWWWVIPLRGDRTSVGLVGRAHSLAGRKPDEAFLSERIAASQYLAERLSGARRVAPVRTISDWSYKSSALAGDRWLMVGDAGAFIDPVFSTGVFLGMTGAFLAADSIERALDRKRFGRASFVGYERRMRKLVALYTDFVKGFYTPEFAELLLHPTDKVQLRAAVTSLLAGHGNSNFSLRWRVALFVFLARLNRKFPLTPRLPGRRESEGRALGTV
jgi:flavin-dependent dehydrogenase